MADVAPRPRSGLFPFFAWAYGLLWGLLALTGAAVAARAPEAVVAVMKNVCAWAPTFAVVILFRRLYPGRKVGEVLRDLFGPRIGWFRVAGFLALEVALAGAVVAAWSAAAGRPWSSFVTVDPMGIGLVTVITLTAGPLGEEWGWRGWALPTLLARRSPLGAALLLGLVWGFWHLPLWILTGYRGIDLVVYALSFLTAIVGMSLFLTWVNRREKNLLVPILLHFGFNFLLRFVALEPLPLIASMAAAYGTVGAVCALLLARSGREVSRG
jgi:hypothetical protein